VLSTNESSTAQRRNRSSPVSQKGVQQLGDAYHVAGTLLVETAVDAELHRLDEPVGLIDQLPLPGLCTHKIPLWVYLFLDRLNSPSGAWPRVRSSQSRGSTGTVLATRSLPQAHDPLAA
jgi:hypothetical protein